MALTQACNGKAVTQCKERADGSVFDCDRGSDDKRERRAKRGISIRTFAAANAMEGRRGEEG